jgi:hypothetical protein
MRASVGAIFWNLDCLFRTSHFTCPSHLHSLPHHISFSLFPTHGHGSNAASNDAIRSCHLNRIDTQPAANTCGITDHTLPMTLHTPIQPYGPTPVYAQLCVSICPRSMIGNLVPIIPSTIPQLRHNRHFIFSSSRHLASPVLFLRSFLAFLYDALPRSLMAMA